MNIFLRTCQNWKPTKRWPISISWYFFLYLYSFFLKKAKTKHVLIVCSPAILKQSPFSAYIKWHHFLEVLFHQLFFFFISFSISLSSPFNKYYCALLWTVLGIGNVAVNKRGHSAVKEFHLNRVVKKGFTENEAFE